MDLKGELGSQVPDRRDTRTAFGNQGSEAIEQCFPGTIVKLIKLQFILVKIGWAETVGGAHFDWYKQWGRCSFPAKKLPGCFRKGGMGFCVIKMTNSLVKEKGKCLLRKGRRRGKWRHTEEILTHEVSAKRISCGYSQLPTGSFQCLFPFEVIYYSPLYSFHPRHIGFLVFLYHTRYSPPQDISTCCSSFWNSLPSTSAWLFPYLLQVCSNLIFKGLPSPITHSFLSSPPSLPYLSAYIGYYYHLTLCFFLHDICVPSWE